MLQGFSDYKNNPLCKHSAARMPRQSLIPGKIKKKLHGCKAAPWRARQILIPCKICKFCIAKLAVPKLHGCKAAPWRARQIFIPGKYASFAQQNQLRKNYMDVTFSYYSHPKVAGGLFVRSQKIASTNPSLLISLTISITISCGRGAKRAVITSSEHTGLKTMEQWSLVEA